MTKILIQMADEDRFLWALDLCEDFEPHPVGGNAFEIPEAGMRSLEPAMAVGAVLAVR